MITYAFYDQNGFVSAGPIEGSDWHGITPEHRFWIDVQEYVSKGGVIEPYIEPEIPMPKLTRRQLKLGLLKNGIAPSAVDAAIEGMEDSTEKEAAKIEWQDATEYERDHHLINVIGQVLQLTDENIDEMWIDASTL